MEALSDCGPGYLWYLWYLRYSQCRRYLRCRRYSGYSQYPTYSQYPRYLHYFRYHTKPGGKGVRGKQQNHFAYASPLPYTCTFPTKITPPLCRLAQALARPLRSLLLKKDGLDTVTMVENREIVIIGSPPSTSSICRFGFSKTDAQSVQVEG